MAFLVAGKKQRIAMRSLDLIEADLRSQKETASFRCDRALVGIRVKGEFLFPGDITYKVTGQYNYN